MKHFTVLVKGHTLIMYETGDWVAGGHHKVIKIKNMPKHKVVASLTHV